MVRCHSTCETAILGIRVPEVQEALEVLLLRDCSPEMPFLVDHVLAVQRLAAAPVPPKM